MIVKATFLAVPWYRIKYCEVLYLSCYITDAARSIIKDLIIAIWISRHHQIDVHSQSPKGAENRVNCIESSFDKDFERRYILPKLG